MSDTASSASDSSPSSRTVDRRITLAVVVGDYNVDITRLMVDKAREHAHFLGAEVGIVVRVPGIYDAPLLVRRLLQRDDVHAVVTLGAVIKGETGHDVVVSHQAARKFIDLSLEYDKPVTLGVSGPDMTRAQAIRRIDPFATRAVEAAVKLVERARALDDLAGAGPHVLG